MGFVLVCNTSQIPEEIAFGKSYMCKFRPNEKETFWYGEIRKK